MKIQVFDDDGSVMYESNTQSMMGVAPAVHERVVVAEAFMKAANDLLEGRLPPLANTYRDG